MNNNPIGIFDSGIGGLSIFKEIKSLLPRESIVYFADSKNCPYGGRSKEEVYRFSREIIASLLKKEVKLVVIACNTVTVSCIADLRHEFPRIPIIGIVPVVKAAAELSKMRRIGILSTTTTSRSQYQTDLIREFASGCEVVNVGTDTLVPFIEKGEIHTEEFRKVLTGVLSPFRKNPVDALALGCSHFPLARDEIQKILGDSVLLLDSGGAVARHVIRILDHEKLFSTKTAVYEFITSGEITLFKTSIKQVLGEVDGTIRSYE